MPAVVRTALQHLQIECLLLCCCEAHCNLSFCAQMLAFGNALAQGSFGGKSSSANLAEHKAGAAYEASV